MTSPALLVQSPDRASDIVFVFILTFGLALGGSVVLTYWARGLGLRLGIVDRPDDGRKRHAKVTARIGGVGVFLAAVVALAVPTLAGLGPYASLRAIPLEVLALGAASLVVFTLGLLDDMRDLRAATKFLVETAVAIGLFSVGLGVGSIALGGGTLVALPPGLDLMLTIFWFVGLANAFNLIDGHDGVAGGVALLALATISFAAARGGNAPVAVAALALSGAVLGFLLFNLPPASVFLGDAGSLFVGFLLAGLGLLAVRSPATGAVPILVPILALGLPVLDTSLAILRRMLRGDPVFRPDRGHIHHRLGDMGYPKMVVTLVMWGLAGIFSLIAVMLLSRNPALTAVGVTLALSVAVLTIRWLEIPELFELARAVRRAFQQRRAIADNVRVRDAVQHLSGSPSAEGLNAALLHAFEDSQCSHIELWVPPAWKECLTTHESFRAESFGVSWKHGSEEGPIVCELAVTLELSPRHVGRLSLRYERPGPEAMAHVDSVVRKMRPSLCVALRTLLEQEPAPDADRKDAERQDEERSGSAD